MIEANPGENIHNFIKRMRNEAFMDREDKEVVFNGIGFIVHPMSNADDLLLIWNLKRQLLVIENKYGVSP